MWDLEMEWEMKKKWETSGNSYLKGKGKGKINLFLVKTNYSRICEMTGNIEQIISLAIWDPEKLGMPRSGSTF